MSKETILLIVAITAIFISIILGAKLIEARRPIFINCAKPINPTVIQDSSDYWSNKF